jgi:hypothetical protein
MLFEIEFETILELASSQCNFGEVCAKPPQTGLRPKPVAVANARHRLLMFPIVDIVTR